VAIVPSIKNLTAAPQTQKFTMGYFSIFVPSLVLTAVLGAAAALLWKPARRPAALAAFWGAAVLVHMLWLAISHLGIFKPIARWLMTAWTVASITAALLLAPFAILTLIARIWRFPGLTPSRLAGTYAGIAVVIGLLVSIPSTAGFIVREEEVRVRDLPSSLDGFRIGHIADAHIGDFIDVHDLDAAVATSDRYGVDLLAISGDLIDDLDYLEDAMLSLERSRAVHGVASVLGNHEKMSNLAMVMAAYQRHQSRIHLLVDDSFVIEHHGSSVRIAGVDYAMDKHGGHMLPRPEQDAAMSASAAKAFAKKQAGETIIALSHHPDFFPFAAEHGAQLTLASHTHGGQVKLFGGPLIVAYEHMQGRYRLGDAQLDVSAGVGHWLPIRIGVPREVVILTLRRGSASTD
jgi:predicted MPP superfamily phosphohydrolase